MSELGVRAGGIDWLARFAEMIAASEATAGVRPPRTEDRWRDRAARFDRMSRKELGGAPSGPASSPSGTSESVEGLARLVEPSDVVIDVGAGTGRHALPLAARCARVIAVEPSAAMRARLLARVAERACTNVEIREGAWPEPEPPVGDVIFSAHVVYGIAEIGAFLGAMTAHARRTCALLLKLRAPADALGDVYEALHGVRRARRPAALEALAVLHQLGHPAELAVVAGTSRPMVFTDAEEDLREVALRIGVSPDEAGRARVRAALDRAAPRTPEGWTVGEAGPSACITWPGRAGAGEGA
jgi:SAM-dependent methyltransferase